MTASDIPKHLILILRFVLRFFFRIDRKVQRESATGSVSNERVHFKLTVAVLDVTFDVEACSLRVKGKNVTENPYIKVGRHALFTPHKEHTLPSKQGQYQYFPSLSPLQLGQHHTIDLELHREFTLIKTEWDSVAIDRIGAPMPAVMEDL